MDALKVGSVDGVMEPQHLRSGGIQLLTRAAQGSLPWQERQHQKKRPLQLLSDIEHSLVFESARGFVLGQVGTHYPAPLEAIQTIERSAKLDRTGARPIEIAGFVKLAKTPVAENLITLFLADQFNKKKTKALIKQVSPLHQAAVLGAGIMGGGIAYQSASKGTPILMKDITPKALALGLGEAVKLLSKQVERKKLSPEDMARTMGAITPTLSYGDFGPVQIAIEAVIENEAIKISVLKELESHTSPECILASNTSTISISRLGASLSRPDKFCGMHFFNPVHKMPLVEIIRGDKTCDQTIAAVVDYALKMGKLPIVVQDCPGFLVNRVLFPYFYGFMKLIEDGVDFVRIDKLMESFGWPMGPAYLLDVIGLDTGVHAGAVMAKAFPDRMGFSKTSAMGVLVDQKRLGQKSGFGFYRYVFDKKGSPKKHFDPETQSLLAPFVKPSRQVVSDESLSDESIIDRMMLPMILETALCLQERIVATPMEADLALIHGLGFPPFRGGVLKYADGMGLGVLCERSRAFEGLGNCYKPGALVQQLAQKHQLFYTQMG
jgi:3-hydroxyacyl-CoA dehydrogenase/enoyl-CoA hydratase/3-hydroxybutyryl-CoA epimerase/enoyl-CoA isomerase